MKVFKTSEMVLKGHPDKLCDRIADAILDDYLKHDRNARTAIEVAMSYRKVFIMGEVSSHYSCDMELIARRVIKDSGYIHEEYGFTSQSVLVEIQVNQQSEDIVLGILKENMGAGDQGMMFGYATDETEEYMPLPYVLARSLAFQVEKIKKEKKLPYLRPDGKMQVTVCYEDDIPQYVTDVVVSLQHDPMDIEKLREDVKQEIIEKAIPSKYINEETTYHINPTGRFVIGGPVGDTGLTGRKIIVDTYGGIAHHGGGSFSGKDATKVDRTGAYYARYVAKNIVATGLARKCEVELSYAIGVDEPTSIQIDTFGTETIPLEEIKRRVFNVFDFRPSAMIQALDLRTPIYEPLSIYGHFGRGLDYTFERLDNVDSLKNN